MHVTSELVTSTMLSVTIMKRAKWKSVTLAQCQVLPQCVYRSGRERETTVNVKSNGLTPDRNVKALPYEYEA